MICSTWKLSFPNVSYRERASVSKGRAPTVRVVDAKVVRRLMTKALTSMKTIFVLIGWVLNSDLVLAASPKLQRDYQGLTVWLDCQEHAHFKFRYNAGHDFGDYPRTDQFRLDTPWRAPPRSSKSSSSSRSCTSPSWNVIRATC